MTGTLTILDGYPSDVLAVTARGEVDGSAYEEVLMPEIERRTARHDRIRMLYVLGEEFEGFTARAAWDDTRLGLAHLHDFSRIALVTDAEWIARGARFFAPLTSAQIRVFGTGQFAAAKTWISEPEADVTDGDPPAGEPENFPV